MALIRSRAKVRLSPEMRRRLEAEKRALFLALCRREGLPAPRIEYEFHPDRGWRFDYAWPTHGIALEVEGGIWNGGRHITPSGFLRDIAKYNAAGVLGWRVLRTSPDQLETTETTNMIRDAMKVQP